MQYLIALIMFSCASDDQPITIDSTEIEEIEEKTVITTEQFNMQEMELDSISEQSFGGAVHCTGMIDIPPEYKANVSSYFGGYVKNIQLVTGTFVKKGQPLFYLENPDFIDLQREFLEKKNEVELLKTEFDRQSQLANSNATSTKSFNGAKSAYEIATVAYNSLKKKLQLMSINPDKLTAENIQSTIIVNSPINGYVSAVNITKGMFLDPHLVAVSIEGVDHKHMELNVYEKDLSKIKIGDQIKMFTSGNPSKYYLGEVYLIDKNIHPENRTIKVHGHFDENTENLHELIPQMYIEGEIATSSKVSPALPEGAVVELGVSNYVLMLEKQSDNEYQFVRKEIQVGESVGGFTEILNHQDLPNAAVYLTKGAFQLIQ